MEREQLLGAVLARGDLACQRAADALRRGVRIFEEWQPQDPKSLAEEFSANDDDGWEDPGIQTFGHDESMAALRASSLPWVATVSLENLPVERWFIHLDRGSGAVVACHGIELL
jgi:hypothetical protein